MRQGARGENNSTEKEWVMARRRRKRARGHGGRPPVLTDQQKRQVRRMARDEIEIAFRTMLGSIGIHYGRRKT